MKKYLKRILYLSAICVLLYGTGRLYYFVTDGFTIGNITSELPYHPEWEITPLSADEKRELDTVLAQPFTYLGKGCQSYVFLSQDGNFVLKFVKYQRFTPQRWLDHFAFIPLVDSYRLKKINKKTMKLNMLFDSWKIAYEELRPETGLLYVHLNKTKDLQKQVVIYDKMGFKHILQMDQMEFLVQRKADMLCSTVNSLMAQGKKEESKQLILGIINLVLSEYSRGLADNDHALMQNTGVSNEHPVHIDVGSFVRNEAMKDPANYKIELFSKTFKFHRWLNKHHPELGAFLEEKLLTLIGPEIYTMEPRLKNHAWSE